MLEVLAFWKQTAKARVLLLGWEAEASGLCGRSALWESMQNPARAADTSSVHPLRDIQTINEIRYWDIMYHIQVELEPTEEFRPANFARSSSSPYAPYMDSTSPAVLTVSDR